MSAKYKLTISLRIEVPVQLSGCFYDSVAIGDTPLKAQ